MHQDPSEHFIVLFEQNCDLKFKRDPFIENNKNIILYNYLFTLKPFGGFTLDISSALEVCLKCT